MYMKAERTLTHIKDGASYTSKTDNLSPSSLRSQINAYSNFLNSVVELARSKWTEFNLPMMFGGLGIMFISLFAHIFAIKWLSKACGISFGPSGNSEISLGLVFAFFMVMIRIGSLFSNSYILEEGKVAVFLLATTGVLMLRCSMTRQNMCHEVGLFLTLVAIVRFTIEIGLSKQAATSAFLHFNSSWLLGIDISNPAWTHIFKLLPILFLMLLAHLLYKTITNGSSSVISKIVFIGTTLSYILIAFYWACDNSILCLVSYGIGRNTLPRIIYVIGFGQISLLTVNKMFCLENSVLENYRTSLVSDSVMMLSAWSSTVIIISGQQGPLVALAASLGGYCIVRFHDLEGSGNGSPEVVSVNPLSVVQWSLFAVCLFFCTGHWCAFDGLRYGAAFIGFDEFVLIQQAILLTIDTFGFSHFVPIFGIPILLAAGDKPKGCNIARLSVIYMMYGFITAATTTATLICVTIHRRHLMVWGLFAPKFVFDVVGLLLTDVLICLATIYFLGRIKDGPVRGSRKER
ncbi:hypothetical protein SAY86_022147 [Trapa natans]|uniref:Uncharacterized protein n=1 Tax=Trapa natans TaxID=22666 RepID=A0AAN7M977_TRANT|nr:hypothetical protein SAY86_022147 [Trapa natans]